MLSKTELDYLETKLFLQTNLDPILHAFIMKIYNRYKSMYDLVPEIHEIRFRMRYCKLLLENHKNEQIDPKTIIAATEETTHYYRLYRKKALNYIYDTLKNGLAATD